MASYGESWIRAREADGIVECGGVRHQGGRGDDASLMALDDGAIDSVGEPEIIGVEYEALH